MNPSDPRYPPIPEPFPPSSASGPILDPNANGAYGYAKSLLEPANPGSGPLLNPPPPAHKVVAQSAAQARQAPSAKSRAPRRLRSPADADMAVVSRNPLWIPHLINALGSHDASVRRAARSALPAFGEAGMIALLRAAAHAHGTVREEAVGCLGEWGDARALQPLLLALEHDRRERSIRLVFRTLLALIGTMAARHPHEAEELWAQVTSTGSQLRIRACAALGRLGDARALTPLAKMARSQDSGVALAARQALGLLLPIVAMLPPDQARLVGPEAVPLLLTLLYDLDEPLVRLTLAALRTVGDNRALPDIERLAADSSRPWVQQEAISLLALLREKAMQEHARSTLLRGTSAPHTRTPDALLRPALSPSHAYPDELLRGAQTPPREPK